MGKKIFSKNSSFCRYTESLEGKNKNQQLVSNERAVIREPNKTSFASFWL